MEFIALHPAAKDISNQRFGRLLALGPAEVKKFPSGANHVYWLCRCDCSAEKIVSGMKLSNGNTKSCGCLRREMATVLGKAAKKHGMHQTPEYEAWHAMHQRCSESSRIFENYAGRGITVCERWQKFENFFSDMGLRPSPDHTLDRYPNNDGAYEPTNCRWATWNEQGRNRRSNFIIEAFGRSEPLICFVRDMDHYHLVWHRIKKCGWAPEKAISEPPRQYTRRSV